ncbi:MAG: hypothetical protein V9E82_14045 [Candidatus Nanopelagicales bacterium]
MAFAAAGPCGPCGPTGPTGPTGPIGPLGKDPALKSLARNDPSLTFFEVTAEVLSWVVPTDFLGICSTA